MYREDAGVWAHRNHSFDLPLSLLRSGSCFSSCVSPERMQEGLSQPLFPDRCSITQSYLTLCDPMDYSPLGSSVHGIFQAGTLEWVIQFTDRVAVFFHS